MGRPKGKPNVPYKPEYAAAAQEMAEQGAIDKEMADAFGIKHSTFYKWRSAHPDFAKALIAGKEAADNRVERSLYQRAVGYMHPETDIRVLDGKVVKTPMLRHYPPDTTACIFWLKNRRPNEWREKSQVDNVSSDGSMTPKVMTLAELYGEGTVSKSSS